MKPPPPMKPPMKPPSSHVVTDVSFAAVTKAPLKVNLPSQHQAALQRPHIPVRPLPQRIAHRPTRILDQLVKSQHPLRISQRKLLLSLTMIQEVLFHLPQNETLLLLLMSVKMMNSFSVNANKHVLLNPIPVNGGKYFISYS